MIRLLSSIIFLVIPVTSYWLPVATTTLPQPDGGHAVGSYNDSIFLIGGFLNPQQLTEYKINTHTFIDHGANALNVTDGYTLSGYAQFYTQKDNILYFTQSFRSFSTSTFISKFGIFDMNTKQYTQNWNNLTMNEYITQHACLASSDNHLYVVGGYGLYSAYMDSLQILSLLTHEWLTNTPTMKDKRSEHACIVDNDYLWAFGGWGGKDEWELDSCERIHTVNILQNQFQYIESLTVALYGLRAVATKEGIYVIGGQIQNAWTPMDLVHIVDPIAATVSLSVERLSYAISYFATIEYNYVIYTFGGSTAGGEYTDSWMYYQLATLSPAPIPTTQPSSSPSSNPSNSPIIVPTTAPTKQPHDSHIFASTSNPTDEPKFSATKEPNATLTMTVTAERTQTQSKYHTSISSALSTDESVIDSTFRNQSTTKEKKTVDFVLIALISVVSLLAIIAIAASFGLYRYRLQQTNAEKDELQLREVKLQNNIDDKVHKSENVEIVEECKDDDDDDSVRNKYTNEGDVNIVNEEGVNVVNETRNVINVRAVMLGSAKVTKRSAGQKGNLFIDKCTDCGQIHEGKEVNEMFYCMFCIKHLHKLNAKEMEIMELVENKYTIEGSSKV